MRGLPSRPWSRLSRLAGWLALAATGCQSMPSRTVQDQAAPPATPAASDTPALAKTDFRRDVGPEQAFNVHLELGRVYESQGNFEAAVAEYQKAAELGEARGSVLSSSKINAASRALIERRMAAAFDRLGRFTQSEVHYRKAMELAPKDGKVWNDVGYSYYLQGRLADAERALKTADSIEPGNARVLTNLGLVLAAAGKDEQALGSLSQAGGPAIGRANMGFILAAQGKTAEARKSYQDALALQPSLAAARQAVEQLDLQTRQAGTTAVASTETRPAPAPVSPEVQKASLSQPSTSQPSLPATFGVKPLSQPAAPASVPAAVVVPPTSATSRRADPPVAAVVAPVPAVRSPDVLPELPPDLAAEGPAPALPGTDLAAARPKVDSQLVRSSAVGPATPSNSGPDPRSGPRTARTTRPPSKPVVEGTAPTGNRLPPTPW